MSNSTYNACMDMQPPPIDCPGIPGAVPLSQISYEEAKIKKEKMIKKMLFLGYEMGYDAARTPAERVMEKKRLCWNHVEAWCKSKHCSINKSLKKYSVEELQKVLTQFEAVHKSFVEQYKRSG